jgi:exopolysaccharide biosynthesis protein
MPILAALLIAGATAAHRALPHVAYSSYVYKRALYHQVIADVGSGMVSPGTVYAGRLESPWQLVSKSQPIVAITGTFFGTGNGHPVADVLVDGSLMARGNRGSGIGVRQNGTVDIFDKGFKHRVDWSTYQFGLRGAVRLVSNGKVQPNPRAQRFHDPRIWGRASRTALGLTRSGKLLIVATRQNVTLSELGQAMVRHGALDAISLDGGSSTCMYYRGKMLIHPARRLSNMFVVCDGAPKGAIVASQ